LKAARKSQWTLAWYGGQVELDTYNEHVFETDMLIVEHSKKKKKKKKKKINKKKKK